MSLRNYACSEIALPNGVNIDTETLLADAYETVSVFVSLVIVTPEPLAISVIEIAPFDPASTNPTNKSDIVPVDMITKCLLADGTVKLWDTFVSAVTKFFELTILAILLFYVVVK